MATTVRETSLPELDSFDSDLYPPEPTRLRPAYGFDDVAIVPGVETIHPADVDLSWEVAGHRFAIPFIASAMDGVVDVPFAIALGQLGGLAVLNLEGLQTRYERPEEPLAEIAAAPRETVTELMQRLYQAPIRDELVAARVAELKAAGVVAAVSATPSLAERLGRVTAAAGVDIFVVQSTVTSKRFRAHEGMQTLDFTRFCRGLGVPVVVGNCVSYAAALELMDTGIAGL